MTGFGIRIKSDDKGKAVCNLSYVECKVAIGIHLVSSHLASIMHYGAECPLDIVFTFACKCT